MTPQDRFTQFMALVESGATTKEIAYQMGVQSAYVSGAKTLLGVTSPTNNVEILRAYSEGVLVSQIAATFGVSSSRISQVANKAGKRRHASRGASQ